MNHHRIISSQIKVLVNFFKNINKIKKEKTISINRLMDQYFLSNNQFPYCLDYK